MKEIFVSNESLYGNYLHSKLVAGEETYNIGTEINETILNKLLENNIDKYIYQKQLYNKGPLPFTNTTKIRMKIKMIL